MMMIADVMVLIECIHSNNIAELHWHLWIPEQWAIVVSLVQMVHPAR